MLTHQSVVPSQMATLEVNGGRVSRPSSDQWLLTLPTTAEGYADAQIDDYQHANGRGDYPWHPGTHMQLRARFSHGRDQLRGTAGFGFWNAPYGDPSVRWPALPQACWFFFASAPNDLPFYTGSPRRGWAAATIDASRPRSLALIPLALPMLLLNQSTRLRRRLWPWVQTQLRVDSAEVAPSLTDWHTYSLDWQPSGCRFAVDGQPVLTTPFSPRGPLGFVAWVDNQYLIASPRGRVGWGTVVSAEAQSLHIADLTITQQVAK